MMDNEMHIYFSLPPAPIAKWQCKPQSPQSEHTKNKRKIYAELTSLCLVHGIESELSVIPKAVLSLNSQQTLLPEFCTYRS